MPSITILAYHNIVERGQESPNDLHSIAVDRLEEQVRALQDAGFEPMALPDAFDSLVHSREHAPGYAVTFDDGYVSLLRYAERISSLAPPTVFVLTGYTGASTASWNTRSSVVLDHLDLSDLLTLRERGFDIQLHGLDHHNLLKFDEEQLRRKFEQANGWFEDHLGQPPVFLAYPYGYCDQRVQGVAARFYRGAFSMTHGAWAGREARYALNRVGVPWFLSGRDLVEVLRSQPKRRWYEIERRAPWRAPKHG